MIKTCLLLFGCAVSLAGQAVIEPQTDGIFYALQGEKLISLERQMPLVHGKVKALGYGGFKVASDIKPGQSPVRLPLVANAIVFVFRTPLASTSADPASIYTLRTLTKKGDKRESITANSHGPLGLGGFDANVAEGWIRIHFERFGEHSLKAVPDLPLSPGEYAFGARVGGDWFCFGVDK